MSKNWYRLLLILIVTGISFPKASAQDFDAVLSEIILASGNVPVDRITEVGLGALDFITEGEVKGKNPDAKVYISTLDGISQAYGSVLDGVKHPSGKVPNGYYASGNWTSGGVFSHSSGLFKKNSSGSFIGSGMITSGFGFRPSFGRMHKGIDISMQVGDTVRVPLSGVIEKIGFEPRGYGRYIIVKHEAGYETRYAHLSSELVAIGQEVESGAAVGLSGNTGNSTGPHLHFEIRLYGEALNPQEFFNIVGRVIRPNSKMLAAMGDIDSWENYKRDRRRIDKRGFGKSMRSTYVVKAGDTLESIARKTGVTTTRLCSLNMLSSSAPLQAGRMLRLR